MALNGFGLGSSFPMRYEAPESTSVAYLPDAETWQTDWEKRRAAEAARARSATAPMAQGFDNSGYLAANPDVANPNSWQFGMPTAPVGAYHYGAHGAGEGRTGSNFDAAKYLQLNPDVAAAVARGEFASAADHFGRHGWTEGRAVNMTAGSPGYKPNYAALNAEQDRMMPLFESQIAQQQAYNNMIGNGQQNAVIGPGYTDPNFGQVDGQIGDGKPPAVPGVDPSWSSGVYNPQGTYDPQRKSGWGWGL